jgi:hypothetical protein
MSLYKYKLTGKKDKLGAKFLDRLNSRHKQYGQYQFHEEGVVVHPHGQYYGDRYVQRYSKLILWGWKRGFLSREKVGEQRVDTPRYVGVANWPGYKRDGIWGWNSVLVRLNLCRERYKIWSSPVSTPHLKMGDFLYRLIAKISTKKVKAVTLENTLKSMGLRDERHCVSVQHNGDYSKVILCCRKTQADFRCVYVEKMSTDEGIRFTQLLPRFGRPDSDWFKRRTLEQRLDLADSTAFLIKIEGSVE